MITATEPKVSTLNDVGVTLAIGGVTYLMPFGIAAVLARDMLNEVVAHLISLRPTPGGGDDSVTTKVPFFGDIHS